MKGQFVGSSFVVTNNSSCTVDVFFEFMDNCPGTWYCCTPAYVITLAAGTSTTIPVTPGEDALMRVYPYGWACGTPCYNFGDFSTGPVNGCFIPSIGAGTSVSGDDCNGTPGALTAEVNGACGTDCMDIW